MISTKDSLVRNKLVKALVTNLIFRMPTSLPRRAGMSNMAGVLEWCNGTKELLFLRSSPTLYSGNGRLDEMRSLRNEYNWNSQVTEFCLVWPSSEK